MHQQQYTLCLITVQNMNKINPFFPEISQQRHMYERVAIILHRAKCYFTSMGNAWYLITVQNRNKVATFFSKILQQTFKFYAKIAITQIWHRAKCYCMCISGPWYTIRLLNMKKIQPAIMEECMRMDSRMN